MPAAAAMRGFKTLGSGADTYRPPLPDGPCLVLGLGDAGQAAAEALIERRGPESVRVWDDSQADTVRAARHKLAERGVAIAPDLYQAIDGTAAVVKSPGIPLDHRVCEAAGNTGIPVLDEFELGWRLSSQPLVTVTGTRGKSTTTMLVLAALEAAGCNPILAGNIESYRGSRPMSAVPRNHEGWVVAEVSSYQAEGSPELLPSAAVLTNLTPDHLNRHGTMEAYFDAKRRLFVRGSRAVRLAVLPADDAFGRVLADQVSERGGRVLTYGVAPDSDYRIRDWRSTLRTGRIEVATPTGPATIESRLPGGHNAANLTAALALADGLNLERSRTLDALSRQRTLPGRFEPVDCGQSFDVVVDLAFGPDGTTRALATARELTAGSGGRVIAVLGGIGSDHRETRQATGEAARAGSDFLVLSATNLRGEPPMIALQGLLAGARQATGGELTVVIDRRRAIARALAEARPGDLVMILGRGAFPHVGHDLRGGYGDFDDREVAGELLRELDECFAR
jgi:UDP-N-acetylmuramoyl-L-alanyl-D-glutamate--2,6-diaminopimelate ligase